MVAAVRRCRTNRLEVLFAFDPEAVRRPNACPNELEDWRPNELVAHAPRPNELDPGAERTERPARTNWAPRRTNSSAGAQTNWAPRRANSTPAPNEPNDPLLFVGWAPPTTPNVLAMNEIRRWAAPTLRREGGRRTNRTAGANELDAAPERTRRPARTNSPPGAGRTIGPWYGTHGHANRPRHQPSRDRLSHAMIGRIDPLSCVPATGRRRCRTNRIEVLITIRSDGSFLVSCAASLQLGHSENSGGFRRSGGTSRSA